MSTEKKASNLIEIICAVIGAIALIIAAFISRPHVPVKDDQPGPDSSTKNKATFLFSGILVDEDLNGIASTQIDIVGKTNVETETNGNFHCEISLDTLVEGKSVRVDIHPKGYEKFDQSVTLPKEGCKITLRKK